MDRKYWAFISYSSKDNRTGSWLHKRLENYPIPSDFRGLEMFDGAVLGKNLRPVFRDRDELSGSANLGEAIGEALESSRFLIVLCSKNSAQSEWVNKEVESFINMGKGDNILALILDGEPNSTSKGRPDDECFPPALQYPAEPIAGDLRKEGDGKERGFLKVLAGITQLDFDQLYRRHERNMLRKRRMIALIAGLLITAFAGLAGYALYQQGVAEVARDKAKIAQDLAEENEGKATAAKLDAIDARDEATASKILAEKNEKLAKMNEAMALFNKKEEERQRLIAESALVESNAQKKIALGRIAEMKYEKGVSSLNNEKYIEALSYLIESLSFVPDHKGARQLIFSILTEINFPLPVSKSLKTEFDKIGLIGEVDDSFFIWGDNQIFELFWEYGEIILEPVYEFKSIIKNVEVSSNKSRIAVWHYGEENKGGEIEILEYSDSEWTELGLFLVGDNTYMKFSPNSKWLYAAGYNSRYILDIEENKILITHNLDKYEATNKSISFSTDSSQAIWIDSGNLWQISFSDGLLHDWDLEGRVNVNSTYLSNDGNWALLADGTKLSPVILQNDSVLRYLPDNEFNGGLPDLIDDLISLPDSRVFVAKSESIIFDFSDISIETFKWEEVGVVNRRNFSLFSQLEDHTSSNSRWIINKWQDNIQVWDINLNTSVTAKWEKYGDIDDIVFYGNSFIVLDNNGELSCWSIDGTGWPTNDSIFSWFINQPGKMSLEKQLYVIPHTSSLFDPQIYTNNGLVNLTIPENHKANTVEILNDEIVAVSSLEPSRGDLGTLKFFDTNNISDIGKTVSTRVLDGFKVLSNDKLALLSNHREKKFFIFDIISEKEEFEIELDEIPFSNNNFLIDLEDEMLVFVNNKKEIGYKELNKPEIKYISLLDDIENMSLASDGKTLAVFDALNWMSIYDLSTGQLVYKYQYLEKKAACMDIDIESGIIAFGGNELNVIDIETGNLFYTRVLPGYVKGLSIDQNVIHIAYSNSNSYYGGMDYYFKIPKQISTSELILASKIIVSSSIYRDRQKSENTPYGYFSNFNNMKSIDWLNIRSRGLILPETLSGNNPATLLTYSSNINSYLSSKELELEFPGNPLTDLLLAVKYSQENSNWYRPELAEKCIRSISRIPDSLEKWSLIKQYSINTNNEELLDKSTKYIESYN